MKISPNMAEKLIGKSGSTTWRDLKVLVDVGFITPEGGTNNLMYVLCPEYHRQNLCDFCEYKMSTLILRVLELFNNDIKNFKTEIHKYEQLEVKKTQHTK